MKTKKMKMGTKLKLFGIVACMLAVLAGCAADESAERGGGQAKPPESAPPQEQANAPTPAAGGEQAGEEAGEADPEPQPDPHSDSTDDAPPADNGDDLVTRLKGGPIVGGDTGAVEAMYGKPDAKDSAGQYLMWRYDYPEGDYAYEESAISIDVQGLNDGRMAAQLVVEFGDDTTADVYSIYYRSGEQIMQYRVTAEGAAEHPAHAD